MVDPARLDELRRLHAERPGRYVAPLASALRRSGDPRAAVELLRPALVAQPDHLTAHVILGQALDDAGDAEGARAAYEHAHGVDAGNVVALGALVRLARAAGDAATAARWNALLLDADPEPEGARAAAEPPPADVPDAEAPVSPFELLDYDEIAAPEPAADARVPNVPMDPVVGLDEAPADPLPAPMRQALPDLLDGGGAAEPGIVVGDDAWAEEGWADDVAPSAVSDEPAAAPPAAPFVTETMAGLLAAQGHIAQALDIYAQLLAQRPNDPRLLAQMAALRGETPTEAGPTAAQVEVGPASDADDEQAARMWRAAFAPVPDEIAAAAPAAVAESADEGAVEDLSFDRFFEPFGDEGTSSAPEPAGDFERWADGVEASAAAPSASAPPASVPVSSVPVHASGSATAALEVDDRSARTPGDLDESDEPDADLVAFNRWLRGVDG